MRAMWLLIITNIGSLNIHGSHVTANLGCLNIHGNHVTANLVCLNTYLSPVTDNNSTNIGYLNIYMEAKWLLI